MRFTGPDGPYQPVFNWPDGICGQVTGKFTVRSSFGRDVPEPVDLLCTRPTGHALEDGHFTELEWTE